MDKILAELLDYFLRNGFMLNDLRQQEIANILTAHEQEDIRPPNIDLSDFTDSEKFAFFKSNIARLIPEQQERLGCHLLFANSQAQIAKRLYNEWLEADENPDIITRGFWSWLNWRNEQ